MSKKFILTQPQDSNSYSPSLCVDRHGVLAALLFACLSFSDLFSKSENIPFLSDIRKSSNLLCDGISQSEDHQAEDKSHTSKDPRNDVNLLLQLFLICLKCHKIINNNAPQGTYFFIYCTNYKSSEEKTGGQSLHILFVGWSLYSNPM